MGTRLEPINFDIPHTSRLTSAIIDDINNFLKEAKPKVDTEHFQIALGAATTGLAHLAINGVETTSGDTRLQIHRRFTRIAADLERIQHLYHDFHNP